MELDKAPLPAFVIAELYKNYLVEESNEDALPPVAATPAETVKQVQYLGKNQQHICILVNYPKDVYLPDEQLSFLTAILQACRLNVGDVAIVNHHRQKLLFDGLKEQLGCNYLLLFDITVSELHIAAGQEFTTQLVDDCHITFFPSLDKFNNNADGKLLKSKLWLCLKQLFNV
jgi:hypothetical protein